MIRVVRFAFAAIGMAAFLVAEAMSDDRTRGLAAALFPSDAEWSEFFADPDGYPLLWVDTYGD